MSLVANSEKQDDFISIIIRLNCVNSQMNFSQRLIFGFCLNSVVLDYGIFQNVPFLFSLSYFTGIRLF